MRYAFSIFAPNSFLRWACSTDISRCIWRIPDVRCKTANIYRNRHTILFYLAQYFCLETMPDFCLETMPEVDRLFRKFCSFGKMRQYRNLSACREAVGSRLKRQIAKAGPKLGSNDGTVFTQFARSRGKGRRDQSYFS